MSGTKRIGGLELLLGGLALAASASQSSGLRYLGVGDAPGTARVHLDDDRVVELHAGERSELGELVAADPDEMIVERATSDDERERYRAAGGVVPDVARIHVRRDLGPVEIVFDPAE